jgi:hypothetical protein
MYKMHRKRHIKMTLPHIKANLPSITGRQKQTSTFHHPSQGDKNRQACFKIYLQDGCVFNKPAYSFVLQIC